MKLKRLVYGVGDNDLPGATGTTIDGRFIHDPFYCAWHGMLMRCYSTKYAARYPTYAGCSVCEEWLAFSVFKSWMIAQNWKGMVLDKDLLVAGNKLYSPHTCVFIPRWLNVFLSNLVTKQRALPMGVSKAKNRFPARYGRGATSIYIGSFATPEQAHEAYRYHRLHEIDETVKRYRQSPEADHSISQALNLLLDTEREAVLRLVA
ncbi:MAG: hypothetical protein IV106_02725 [Pseudomonas umsongensis]|nr:hypothetical protein [Pseudomonas umsongensis]